MGSLTLVWRQRRLGQGRPVPSVFSRCFLLVMWLIGIQTVGAETPTSTMEISTPPAATMRVLDSQRPEVEQASAEVWVSSDEPLPSPTRTANLVEAALPSKPTPKPQVIIMPKAQPDKIEPIRAIGKGLFDKPERVGRDTLRPRPVMTEVDRSSTAAPALANRLTQAREKVALEQEKPAAPFRIVLPTGEPSKKKDVEVQLRPATVRESIAERLAAKPAPSTPAPSKPAPEEKRISLSPRNVPQAPKTEVSRVASVVKPAKDKAPEAKRETTNLRQPLSTPIPAYGSSRFGAQREEVVAKPAPVARPNPSTQSALNRELARETANLNQSMSKPVFSLVSGILEAPEEEKATKSAPVAKPSDTKRPEANLGTSRLQQPSRASVQPFTPNRFRVLPERVDLRANSKTPTLAQRPQADEPQTPAKPFEDEPKPATPKPEPIPAPSKPTPAPKADPAPAVPARDMPPAAPVNPRPVPPRITPVPAPVQHGPTTPSPFVADDAVVGPFEVIEESGEMSVMLRRSKLLRTRVDIYRTAVVDPAVCDVVQFTPREISIIGKGQGATHVTFWFNDESYRPITYLVRVVPDPEVQKRREEQYGLLAERITELFPNSKIELTPLADKLIVRGQARDAAEAAQILAIIRGEAQHLNYRGIVEGRAADPLVHEESGRPLPPTQVVNMLRIPGVQQIALRVKIAELNRTAARNCGVDMDMSFDDGKVILRSLLNAASGGTATLMGNLDGGDIKFGIHYLEKHGVMRMLSEPTLVTLSGRPATFIAGGEFAVPTTVGVNGASAVTTDFRAYGAIITFLPIVIDKDHIRLEVAPEFSKLNTDLTVNGTPALNTRAVTTTVEMREGQTLAIAGLLDDSMKGDNAGNIPLVAQIFGKREMTRNETELLILVTPELVQPMEPEAVPPLPGFDVTEPTNCQFFVKGHLEGRPTEEYRSTVWPHLRHRYQAGGPAMISGPFGHAD